jgi:hypothetical protein
MIGAAKWSVGFLIGQEVVHGFWHAPNSMTEILISNFNCDFFFKAMHPKRNFLAEITTACTAVLEVHDA